VQATLWLSHMSHSVFMVPTVRGGRKVKECRSTRVQKLTKVQKKIFNCCIQTVYNSLELFLLASLADYLYLHF